MMIPLVFVQEYVEHGPDVEVGAVPDRLYHGYGMPCLQERVCPGPKAQLRSFHDLGLTPQLHTEGTH